MNEKYLDKQGLISYTSKMKEYINSKVESFKPDWNEVDNENLNYIQNRTHYDDDKVFLDLDFELTQEILQELDWQGGGGSGEYSNIPYTGTHPWPDAFIDAEDVENLPYIRVDAGKFDDDGYHRSTDTLVPLKYDISKIVFTVKYNGVSYSGTPYLVEDDGYERYYGLGDPNAIYTYKYCQVTDPLPQPEQANFPFALWIEYQSVEGIQEGINHVGIICGSRPISAGDYGVKIEYKNLKKLDTKFIPTASSIADGEIGYVTGDQVYDALQTINIQSLSNTDLDEAFVGIHLDWYKVNGEKINTFDMTSENSGEFHQYITETDLITNEDKHIYIVGEVLLDTDPETGNIIPVITVNSANYVTISGSTISDTLESVLSDVAITGIHEDDSVETTHLTTEYKGLTLLDDVEFEESQDTTQG